MSPAWLNPAERAKFLAFMEDRFGIPPTAFDGHALFRKGEFINAVSRSAMEAVVELKVEDAGIQLGRVTHSGSFKPVSRGMQVFGNLAAKNVVLITREDLKALIQGRKVDAPEMKGFVLLRCAGAVVGVGLAREGKLESQLPRNMTEHLALSAGNDLV